MKKKSVILLLSVVLALSSCGEGKTKPEESPQSNPGTNTEIQQESNESKSDSDPLGTLENTEADEGTFDVKLNIPADFIGDQTQEDLDAIAKEYGFKSITLNTDGSATYIMTKKQHEEFLSDCREQIRESLDEMIGSEDYPNFTKIETNDNFTEFTVITKSTELSLNESFSVMAFYMNGGLYNVFSGEEVNNISVTFINADSGEVIQTANSSEMGQ